jgi:adenylate cyclase
MFGQYVPPTHIDEMLKEGAASYGLYGEDRDMTVLFSDIRNFTSISESMSASQVKEMLNEFFTPMTEIIFKFRGTIDKYVGDLIMAFWGAPLKDKRHAQHAISAALEMQKKLEQDLEPLLLEHGWPEIHIGIGINSGIMTVGDMGSKFRRNYTVLGDAVNLASRIEGLTKFYGVRIIITEATAENQEKFIIRQLDRVRVKGKEEGIGIYEVIGTKEELTSELNQELEASRLALNYYFERNWEKAKEIFAALNKKHPEEKLYSVYLERLARYEKNPPPEDWQGIYTHAEKHFD